MHFAWPGTVLNTRPAIVGPYPHFIDGETEAWLATLLSEIYISNPIFVDKKPSKFKGIK